MRTLSVIFFISGGVGLTYEVIWTRLFSHVLGSSALSMAVVFSCFLVALAVGAELGGRVLASGVRAIRLYGYAELGIGALSLTAGLFLFHARWWLMSVLPDPNALGLRMLVASMAALVVIGPPAALMGATLPLALNGVRMWELPHQAVARLYGWNTFGGACGALATGFALLWTLGLLHTLYLGAALNVLAGSVALHLSRSVMPAEALVAQPQPDVRDSNRPIWKLESAVWPLIAFVSGFVVLGCEILWGRIARFVLGDRTFAMSYLLFVFLTSLAIGSFVAPRIGASLTQGRRDRALGVFAPLFATSAVVQMVMVFVADRTIAGGGLASIVPGSAELTQRLLITWCLIFPTAVLLGLTFPLLAWSARRIDDLPGRVTGSLYFVNTIGAVLGAAAAGFALSRSVGTMNGFQWFASLQVVTAIGLLVVAPRVRRLRIATLSAVILFAAVLPFAPTELIWLRPGEHLLTTTEDEYGVQVMTRTSRDLIRVRNNRLQLIYDLGHWQTTHAQEMAAHLTVLLAENVTDVINIGTGYGITAGAFTLYPDITRIDTVEILPFLVDHQSDFREYNREHYRDPRVNVATADGRHYLLRSERRWDIISVNVLDPYLPGSSSLYSVDFWKEARDHLKPGGVYTQLFWGEDKDLLIRGLRTVFPTALYFPAYGNTSWNVVAFKDPISPRGLEPHLERISEEARPQLKRWSRQEPSVWFPEYLSRAWQHVAEIEEAALSTPGRLHTDEYPILEFRWMHNQKGIFVFDSPLTDQ